MVLGSNCRSRRANSQNLSKGKYLAPDGSLSYRVLNMTKEARPSFRSCFLAWVPL